MGELGEGQIKKFEWRTPLQHIIYFIAYMMEWWGFCSSIYEDTGRKPKDDVTWAHYFVVALVVGNPIIFFQTFIGHYTRRGCLVVGRMLPFAQGFGYTMLLLSFGKFVIQFYYTQKVFYYFMAILNNFTPPWMKCFKSFYKIYPQCFSKEEIDLCPSQALSDKPCFEPGTKTLAPYIFKEHVAFYQGKLKKDSTLWVFDQNAYFLIRHAIHVGLTYFILLIALKRQFRMIDLPLRLVFSFCLMALLSIMVVVFIRSGADVGLKIAFTNINHKSLTNIDTWMAAFMRVTERMRLAEGGHYLFGSFIPVSDRANHRSLHLTLSFMILCLFTTLYFHLFEGLIIYKFNMSLKDLDLESEESTVFITYPMILGLQASPFLYCIIYFLVLGLLSFSSLIIKIMVIEKCITEYLNISEFYFYVRFGICTMGMVLTFSIIQPGAIEIFRIFKHHVHMFSVFAMLTQNIILFLYGYQRVCDDVLFFTRSKVSWLLRACSIAILCSCVFIIYLEFMVRPASTTEVTIRLVTYMALSSPFFVCFVYQIYAHIKKKNIIGILRPTDDYGFPDIELRILRILYNPRLAARYKRKQICSHVCLLKSGAFVVAIQEEIELIRRFVAELQMNEADKESCELENDRMTTLLENSLLGRFATLNRRS